MDLFPLFLSQRLFRSFKLEKEEEYKTLTVEELVNYEANQTVWYPIDVIGLKGKVEIRPIKDYTEYQNIFDQVKKFNSVAKVPGTDLFGLSTEQVIAAIMLHNCMVTPKMGLESAFKLVRKTGMALIKIVDKIGAISGLDENAIKEAEEKLKENSFRENNSSVEPEILQETTETD